MLKQQLLLSVSHQSNFKSGSLSSTKTLIVAQDVPQPSASSQELTRNANISWGLLVGGGLVFAIAAMLYFRYRRRRIVRKQSGLTQHVSGKAHKKSRPLSNCRSDRSSGDDYYISSDAYSGSGDDQGCTLIVADSSLGSSDDTDNSYSSNPSSDTSSSCISDDSSSHYTSDSSDSCSSYDSSTNYTSDSSDSCSSYDSSTNYTSDSSWSSDSSSSCSSYDSSSSSVGGGESGGGGAGDNW
ncbi:MAG TPA: hypothetical protein V6D11_17280 [Waterburya sp.]